MQEYCFCWVAELNHALLVIDLYRLIALCLTVHFGGLKTFLFPPPHPHAPTHTPTPPHPHPHPHPHTPQGSLRNDSQGAQPPAPTTPTTPSNPTPAPPTTPARDREAFCCFFARFCVSTTEPVPTRSGPFGGRSDPFGGQPRYAIMLLRTLTRSEGVRKPFATRSRLWLYYAFDPRSDPFGYRTQSGCVQRPQGQAKARFCWLVPEPNTFCPPQTPKCLVPYHPKPQNAKFSTTRNSNHSVLDSYHADILLQDIDLTLKLMTCDQFSHQFDMELNGNLQENKHMWSSVCISAESLTRQCSTIPSLVSTHAFSALK